MNRAVVVAVVVLLAACTTSHASGSHTAATSTSTPTRGVKDSAIILTRVVKATSALRSFRFVAAIRFETTDGGGGVTSMETGGSDLVAHASELTSTVSNSTASEYYIFAGSHVFARLPSAPSPMTRDWCVARETKKVRGPGVSVSGTLAQLGGSGRAVTEVGTETVRGVSTTHYVVTGGGRPRVEIWVDASDQLRRIRWTLTTAISRQDSTTDLFDFNTSIPILVPVDAAPCNY